MDPTTASLIAQAAMTGTQMAVDYGNSKRQQRFAVGMAKLQQEQNMQLADYAYAKDMEQLQYMNQYNAPINQRKRLELAGLNPALMYNSAPQNVQTKTAEYHPLKTDYQGIPARQLPNPLEALSRSSDISIKHAQFNNMEAQRENIEIDTALKAASKAQKLVQTARAEFDYDLAKSLRAYSSQIVQETARKRLAERVNEIARNEGILSENELKRLQAAMLREDLELRKQGIYPGDAAYVRLLFKALFKLGFDMNDLGRLKK